MYAMLDCCCHNEGVGFISAWSSNAYVLNSIFRIESNESDEWSLTKSTFGGILFLSIVALYLPLIYLRLLPVSV